MWEHFAKNLNGNAKIDFSKSFYCGDAAGRAATKDRPKDFTDTDIKFAFNIGIPFKTPEDFFLGIKDKLPNLGLKVQSEEKKSDLPIIKGGAVGDEQKIAKDKQEIILFCGAPGSGKSTFWKNYLSKYERVNNDTLKTKEKCIKVCEEAIKQNKSVVIDNTNSTAEQRTRYIEIAKKYKIPCRLIKFDVNKETCMHNNKQRKINLHR